MSAPESSGRLRRASEIPKYEDRGFTSSSQVPVQHPSKTSSIHSLLNPRENDGSNTKPDSFSLPRIITGSSTIPQFDGCKHLPAPVASHRKISYHRLRQIDSVFIPPEQSAAQPRSYPQSSSAGPVPITLKGTTSLNSASEAPLNSAVQAQQDTKTLQTDNGFNWSPPDTQASMKAQVNIRNAEASRGYRERNKTKKVEGDKRVKSLEYQLRKEKEKTRQYLKERDRYRDIADRAGLIRTIIAKTPTPSKEIGASL